MSEREKYQPSVEEIVEAKFGKESIERATAVSKEIFKMIKQEMARIGLSEGSSADQKKAVEEYLEMWRNFSGGLFARVASENARSPEVVKTAIEGANALLSVQPAQEYNEAAQAMKKALETRYGKE